MFFKDSSKVYFCIDFCCLFERFGCDRRFVNLLEKELIGDGEVGAKAFVEGVNQLREGELLCRLDGCLQRLHPLKVRPHHR
jgi:hypothetical protein